jgi:hypothetical protein
MKNTKFIICLILSLTIGIAVATPLIRAELTIRPWITQVQGPTAPFNVEVVYTNFTITDPDTPITQTSGPTINYYAVINVTNPSEYRTILNKSTFFVAQSIQSTTSKTALIDFYNFTSTGGGGGEAKGAWVDNIYYNVTLTIPYPIIGSNGIIIQEIQSGLTEEELYTYYYQWIEGVQYFKHTIKEDTSINTYTYLNRNGTWVDITGRVTIDETEPEYSPTHIATGGFISRSTSYLGSGSKASKDNEYDCFFAPGESRLLVVSGSLDIRSPWAEKHSPVDIIQSSIIQTLTQVSSYVDIDPIGKNNTFIVTSADTSKIQELVLTQVGNSYIYNTVLSDNQTFEFDQYGFEVFIVPVR